MTREEAIPVIDILISKYFVEAHNNGYLDYQRAEIIEALEMARQALESSAVRCEECKFWDGERVSCEGLAKCVTGESGLRYRSKNDFCSRGQRKENKYETNNL